MILLGVACIYGITVSSSIFGTWLFLALAALLFVNMAACTWQQFRRAWTATNGTRLSGKHRTGQDTRCQIVPDRMSGEKVIAGCKNTLRRFGYRVGRDEQSIPDGRPAKGGILYGWKGRAGFWGSPLFHLALLIMLTGAALSGLGRTSEDVMLNEGTSWELSPGKLSFGPAEVLNLKQVRLDFSSAGRMTEWKAYVSLQNGNRAIDQVVTSEREYEDGQFTMSIQKNGYTPGLIISQNGQPVGKVRVLLETVPVPGGYLYTGEFPLSGDNPSNHKLIMSFWPNFSWYGNQPATDGDDPRNPALSLTMADQENGNNNAKDETTGKPQVIKPGETASFGQWAITFDHYKPWLMLRVVRDPGYMFVYGGFWLAVAGLVLLYGWSPRAVIIRFEEVVEGSGLRSISVSGWSYRQKSFRMEDVQSIAAGLDQMIKEEREHEPAAGHRGGI